MSAILKTALILAALAGAPVGYVFYSAVLSSNDWIYQGSNPSNWKNGGVHGAPGPIAGAGLPVIGIAFGAWLYRRYRRRADLGKRDVHEAASVGGLLRYRDLILEVHRHGLQRRWGAAWLRRATAAHTGPSSPLTSKPGERTKTLNPHLNCGVSPKTYGSMDSRFVPRQIPREF
jgi:hypothetical protein